jgi:hypothetical protein
MWSLRPYVEGLWLRWWALLGSGAFTVVATVVSLASKPSPINHTLIVSNIIAALVLFVIASFGAWKQQYDARLVAERKIYDTRPIFVLEANGTQSLNENSDWRFFLSNHGGRLARYVQLSTMRSEVGAYEISFMQIPALPSGQPAVMISYTIYDRRANDARNLHPTLRDFALDNAGETGNSYFRYKTRIKYQDTDESEADGGTFDICFDLYKNRLE